MMAPMNRRTFITIGGTLIAVAYVATDTHSVTRSDLHEIWTTPSKLLADERAILFLASLAPSGHNTQPWFIKYNQPYDWIIGNDHTRWLPAVDASQRETVLSIGAFLQNLEYAASFYGYSCAVDLLAKNNQDAEVARVTLAKIGIRSAFEIDCIKLRRTLRSGFKNDPLKKMDIADLIGEDGVHLKFLPRGSRENEWLNEQTIEANRLQCARDNAQQELSNWVRFSSKDARQHADGLTTASMEIQGVEGLFVRNFYSQKDVMTKGFRAKSLESVREQVANSAGWMVITSPGDSVASLIEAGMRMQRLFLQVRKKGIAIHPMTQILEEPLIKKDIYSGIGISIPIQFILRMGYVDAYPEPVSLRREVQSFVR
jgi:hypothetical protein